MGSEASDINNLDRLRSQLEENVAKLRKTLQVWQTWEAEFEGLKEEILTLPDEKPSRDDLVALARDYYEGGLVDERDVQTLFQGPSNTQRTRCQIVDVLSRRIDYVRQNVQTVEKQLQAAETKLDSILVKKTADGGDQNELPLTEIREDLDEESNVISSVKSTPGSAAPEILQALKKAGITEVEDKADKAGNSKSPVIKDEERVGNAGPDRQYDPILQKSSRPRPSRPSKRNKSVRFTEDTKSEDAPSKTQLALRPKGIQNRFPNKGTTNQRNGLPSKVLYMQEEKEEEEEKYSPIIPVDESPEDAALRREMIQYGLSEVGAVVAELNIDEEEEEEEDGSVDSNDEEHGYTYEEDDLAEEDEDDEEEDKYGRTTRRVVSEAYVKEMQALQKKLEAQQQQSPSNKGPKPEIKAEERKPTFSSSGSSSSTTPSSRQKQKKTPISDTIIEHALSISPSTTTTQSASDSTDQEPDELDPAIMRQEIAVEYHHMRNRMIHRQGGFLKRPEEEENEEGQEKVPLTPEEGGERKKKISRFKAARLGR